MGCDLMGCDGLGKSRNQRKSGLGGKSKILKSELFGTK